MGWSLGLQAGGGGVPTYRHHILDPVLCCPPPGVPLFHPSRVRQLEEELRTMDQSLKSLIASEEEVLGQGHGAMCSSPLSLSLSLEPCKPPLSFLHHCLHHRPPLASLSSGCRPGTLLHPSTPASLGGAGESLAGGDARDIRARKHKEWMNRCVPAAPARSGSAPGPPALSFLLSQLVFSLSFLLPRACSFCSSLSPALWPHSPPPAGPTWDVVNVVT